MTSPAWTLSADERATLGAALDALLPPHGAFPAPSAIRLIDDFIIPRVPLAGERPAPYPRLTNDDLRAIVQALADATTEHADMTAALQTLEQTDPTRFTALWRLAVFGYYSRPEVIAAIQHDLAPAYHGAPLPLGYAHAIEPWDASNPHNFPTTPRGHYVATDAVQRVDLSQLPADLLQEPAVTAPPDPAADPEVESIDHVHVDVDADVDAGA